MRTKITYLTVQDCNSLQLYVHIQPVVRDLHIKTLGGLQELQLGVLRVVLELVGAADEQGPHRLESAAHVEGFSDGEVCVVGPRLVQRVKYQQIDCTDALDEMPSRRCGDRGGGE